MVAQLKSRRRKIHTFGATVTLRMGVGGPIHEVTHSDGHFFDLEETSSEGHRWPPKPGESLRFDRGGPFTNRKCRILSMTCPNINTTMKGSFWGGSTIVGTLGSPHWPVVLTQLPFGSDAGLLAKGTTAVSRCQPLKSKAQLGTLVGELAREGLPRLVGTTLLKTQSRFFRDLGDEYLNIEFGWKPFISDLRASIEALGKASKIMTQLSRDSGKPVRRRYTFPIEETVTILPEETDYGSPVSLGTFYTAAGKCHKRVVINRRVWFSGEFMYHLPHGDDFLSKVGEWQVKAHRLLGARLDPELLWNLAPWTWLADWFGNIGDVVSNASAYLFDGLVMKYGYVMEHYTEVSHFDTVGIRFSDGATASPQASFLRETKRRLGATPFGFGLDEATLSEWQLSILVALGITRR